MPASKPQLLPHLFHTLPKGMEAGKPCETRTFHTFHTFHTCFSRVHVRRVQAHRQAQARVHLRTPDFFSMEGMEGMEEGHRTMIFSVHTSSTPRQGMEPKEIAAWTI